MLTEPPPTGWVAAGDYVVKHAETSPNVIFPLLSIVSLFTVIIGAGYIFVRFALPAWREEKKADREHLTALVVQRGKEALEDVEATRNLAKAQHAAIVSEIGERVSRVTGEIARLVERSEKHGDLLRSVAQKLGGVVLAVAILLGVIHGVMLLAQTGDAPIRCDPPCSTGWKCTTSGCQEIKTGTASIRKHSTLRLVGYANMATADCLSGGVVCP